MSRKAVRESAPAVPIEIPRLTNEDVLWLAAIDCLPIEERIEWVAVMLERVERINASRPSAPASQDAPEQADE